MNWRGFDMELPLNPKRSNYKQRMLSKGFRYCDPCGCWYLDKCGYCEEVATGKNRLERWYNAELESIVSRIEKDPAQSKDLILEFAGIHALYVEGIRLNDLLRNSEAMNFAIEWESKE